MGDPSNRNQSHLLQGRSTSRVLAPPGGHSTFSLGGYGGAPDYSTSNRRAPAPKPQESYQSRAPPQESYAPQREERRGSIPGLESHYSGGGNGGRQDSNRNDYADNSNSSRNKRYDDDEDDEQDYRQSQNSAPKGMLRSNQGFLSGNDYAAQLKAQIAMKKNIDSDNNGNDPYSGNRPGMRQESQPVGHSHASRNAKTIADSRHDSAMQAYSKRQETDREKDYKRMQNMSDMGSQRNGDRNGDRNSGRDNERRDERRDSGSNYKVNSPNASGSAPVHTSTRVHAPPGGHSSFQIGWG